MRLPGRVVVALAVAVVAAVAVGVAALGAVGARDAAREQAAESDPTAHRGLIVPQPGATWQWQLSGPLDLSHRVDVWDVDGFDTPKSVVRALRARGDQVICYLSVGSRESWRPDADRFPESLIGKRLDGWRGERWLDIRRRSALRPIMRARIKMCQRKGFTAVEPDNVDAHNNDSGFGLSSRDQIRFNKMIARLAHRKGMAVALKNDLDQVRALEPHFDFAINEQCARYRECRRLRPFLRAGKAVLHVEYKMPRSAFCRRVPAGFSSLRKAWRLGDGHRPCR